MKRDKIAVLAFFLLLAGIAAFLWFAGGGEPKMLSLPVGDTYDADWAKVDAFEAKGRPRSAFDQVKQIATQAYRDGNEVQLLKAAIRSMRYVQSLDNDAELQAEAWLKAGISATQFPVRQVFHSILGQLYWNHALANQRWISGRTGIQTNLNEDLRTWDLERLAKEADQQYVLSLVNPEDLRRVKIDHVDAVLRRRYDGRPYRPTLLDLLAWRALNYYSNDQAGVVQPAFQFQMNDPAFFSDGQQFEAMPLHDIDPTSYQLKSLRIFQLLTRLHAHDSDPRPRVMVALERLKYVHHHAVSDQKDSLFLHALQRQYAGNKENDMGAFAAAEIANVYLQVQHDPFGPEKDKTKDARRKAMQVLEEALDLHQDTDGGRYCTALRDQLMTKDFKIDMDAVHVPNQPILASLSYQNLDQIWLRIVKVDKESVLKTRNESFDMRVDRLSHETPVKAWTLQLPKDTDFNRHRLEFGIPALPLGSYVLLAGSSAAFSTEEAAVALTNFDVSNMGYSMHRLNDGQSEYIVMDRQSGQPMEGVTAKVLEEVYNYDTREDEWKLRNTLQSTANGLLSIGNLAESHQILLELIHGPDTLLTASQWLYDYGRPIKKMTRRTTFFTDRAIYRPGQTIFFKGIVLEGDGETNRIVPQAGSEVVFRDANGQKVAALQLKTNEFGSFAGSFTAPQGLMNGRMTIGDGNGSVAISVEDYKRPKFEVSFDPIKGSFQLGAPVKVTGKAIAYAGSILEGAEVRYRVVRSASFPWCGFWGWKGSLPTRPAMEIKNGSLVTDASGAFEIEFQAIPDPSLDQSLRPKFTYEVMADVVDITGETHSASTIASVGYQAIELNIAVPEEIERTQFRGWAITTNNLNGEPEATQGTVEIRRVEVPKALPQVRRWDRPDRFVLSKADFQRDFPGQVYDNEDDPSEWPRKTTVFQGKFDTKAADSVRIPDIRRWAQGSYEVTGTCKDKFGNDVKFQRRFTLTDAAAKNLPMPAPLWAAKLKPQYEPGDTALIDFGSQFSDGWVFYEVIHRGKVLTQQWLRLSEQRTKIKIPIEEKHRGNLSISLHAVHGGRIVDQHIVILVPWSNKRLDIEYATFRDKLLPGAKEEWTVKIKGPKGERAAAELLAGMYDQSLDAFQTQDWGLSVDPTFYDDDYWTQDGAFSLVSSELFGQNWNPFHPAPDIGYDVIDLSFLYWTDQLYSYPRYALGFASEGTDYGALSASFSWEFADGAGEEAPRAMALDSVASFNVAAVADVQGSASSAGYFANKPADPMPATTPKISGQAEFKFGDGRSQGLGNVQVRKNLNETAFFYPQLRTDAEGSVILKFTMPEALTKWKLRTFAHTRDLKTGYKEASVVTQKELMVQPNPPRFFRENDAIVYTAKLSNLSDRDLSGQVQLQLMDALTMQPIDRQLGNAQPMQTFALKKGQSKVVSWKLKIPAGIEAVTHIVKAAAGNVSDGEESSLPVLTNSMLVTEAMPMPVRPLQTKTFDFKRLTANKSTTIRQHKLTLEFTSNPAWYAIQALPYMMEFPYECTEQTFSRYYANAIATHIANKHPKIKEVFAQWKAAGQSGDAEHAPLLSKLEKNEELKYLLLEETPWVMDAQDETERKKRVGLLFDLVKMAAEQDKAKQKLLKAQTPNGGFTWFPGMPDSRYITQHLVCGFGHLDHLGVKGIRQDAPVWSMLQRAVGYLDQRIKEDNAELLKYVKRPQMELQHIGWDQVHYLYARSFFQDIPVASECVEAVSYYLGQARKYWLQFNAYNQGMIALALHRGGDKETPQEILVSLKERSQTDPEMGMYWKGDGDGLYWYQAPIETQALLIEAFGEVANDQASVEEMKLWLLKQKQTQDWKTTKATAEACYALLLSGADYLAESKLADITIGGKHLNPANDPSLKVEAGTGYFKTSWSGAEITPTMGRVEVKNNNKVAAWGAVYWQYFEQLDRITFAPNKISVQKQLFLQESSPTGPKLHLLSEAEGLSPGDLVKVRIILETDRDMEYVHMKDMRAAGFEPINVLSQYKYQDGLGYYESTRDAATNFFFDWLPKGRYVFEYPLRATHRGDFSNGITTVQCMYAPEFTAHGEGVRVRVN